MDVALLNRNGLTKLGGVLHLGAGECEEMQCYDERGAQFVVWVEANPDKWKICENKLGTSPQRHRHDLIRVAVSDHDGTETLRRYGCWAWSSLLDAAAGSDAPPRIDEITVNAVTVDTLLGQFPDLLGNVAFLVMDVQGAEMKALAGAKQFLAQPALTHIYTEVHWKKQYENAATQESYEVFLKEFGFRLADKDEEGIQYGWGNLLFAR